MHSKTVNQLIIIYTVIMIDWGKFIYFLNQKTKGNI